MRIIRYLLLSLVCSFSLCAKADTNVNYTAQLAQIYSILNNMSQLQQEIYTLQEDIGLIIDDISHDVRDPYSVNYWHGLGDAILDMRRKTSDIHDIVSSIEAYASYIIDIFNKTDSINSYLYNQLTADLSAMQDSLASLDTFGDSLQDIVDAVNNAASYASDIAMHQDDLNQEETQLEILDALEDIRGRITVFPEEDIHRLVSIGEDILEHLTDGLRIMQKWENIFDFWDEFYYRQFNGMGNFTIDYYRLLGSPDFTTGYDPRLQTANYETGNFVQSLYALLRGHLNLLESINDGVLYLCKGFSTNGQAQAENDFQQQKDEVSAYLDSSYNQLREYTYRGISYNLHDTKLYDVSSFISSFETSSYEPVQVHAVDISGFEVFGNLPTYFEFKYDLTPIASYLELVRNVFTIFWVLFFASFWIFLVSLFYRFYNFLYRLLCMVPGQSAPPPGPGLPVPSGGAVMA